MTSLDSIAITVNVTTSLSIPEDTFRPDAGETATIRTTLTGTVPARVRIRNNVGIEIRTLVDETRVAGTYNDPWDGRDDAGDLLPNGDYYAILEYDSGGETKRIDLTDSTGGSQYNPARNRLPSRFDPYENDPLPITFTVSSNQGASTVSSNQGASGILAFVGLYNTNTRLVTLLDRKPFGVGTHTIYWDGLLPDGSFAVLPPGDSFLFGIWGYTLPDNAIYLSSAPIISNFSVQPTLNSPTRDGSRPFRITFDLDQDADLELLVVLDPLHAAEGVLLMKHTPLGFGRGVLLALLLGNGMVLAEDLRIEHYVELSIARLELAKESWTATQHPPTPEAMAALFAGYGIEESDYLAYGGTNRKSIAAYLAAHPQAKQRIEALSAHIDQAIKE